MKNTGEITEFFFPGSYFVADLAEKNDEPPPDMVSGYETAPRWNITWPFHIATIALLGLLAWGLYHVFHALLG